jgi:uncharacterized integral membrane protein (TIGR00698 family)
MSTLSLVAPAPGLACAPTGRPKGRLTKIIDLLPGLALASGIAGLAFALRRLPGVSTFSPLILAMLLGIGVQNVFGTPARARAGVSFTLKKVLRFAIALLGLQLTAQQVAEVGVSGVAIILTTLIATFGFAKWFGRMLGVERGLAELIAAGTSICGASAVIAVNTVTEAADEDVAYAVACVTVFGSIAMFAYPLLPGLLHLSPRAYGLWAGASIHEIAQVVAAAFQAGKTAGDYGTIAKLTRVAMLAPVVVALGMMAARSRARSAVGTSRKPLPTPWFVLGFILLVAFNSLVAIPAAPKVWIVTATGFLLSLGPAAMGLETDLGKLRAKGLRPLTLGAAAAVFIAGFSLALVELIVWS